MKIFTFKFWFLLFSFIFLLSSTPAFARIYIPVDQPSDKKFPIAITNLVADSGFRGAGDLSKKIPSIIKNDLTLSSYFEIMPESSFLDKSSATTAETINFAQWTAIEAGALVKGTIKKDGGKFIIQLKLFDPYSSQMLIGKQYTAEERDIRSVAHRFSDEIMEALTGKRGIFNTKIAYTASTGKNGKAVYIMDVDGETNQRITRDNSLNLGPSWSPDGGKLVYASYQKGNPEIFMADMTSGHVKQLTHNKSTNITPAFSPSGDKVYYSSSLGNATELFAIPAKGGAASQVSFYGGINIAPRFSKDGETMIFSSTMPGRLHVYRQPVGGGPAKRLTFVGIHNDSPDISPDGTKIVFCGQDMGAFDIFTMNSDGTNIQRLTIDSGSNEHPRWSPDGRFIVFSSTRSGGSAIYMMRADGANQAKISQGNGQLPDWGPWLK